MEKYLSLKKGRPIAFVSDGKYKNNIVGLVVDHNPSSPNVQGNSKVTNILDKLLKDVKDQDTNNIINRLLSGKRKDSTTQNIITDNKGHFEYIPNIESDRECLYICGPSGSGKSYFCARYTKKYKKLFPNNEVYLFSTKDSDPQLDALGINRVMLDEDFIDTDLSYDVFANSLCIFDDVDALEGQKELSKAVWGLRDTLLKNGRSQHTYMLNTIHEMFGYRSTRTCLSESQMVVFFPNNGSDAAIKKYLIQRAGINKDVVNEIMLLPSRWIGFYTHSPRFVIWERGVRLL